ncbi:MAG: glycosyltransferase family 39 protein [Bacteroidetes bacterium]|nr:glycosyltransferase family 39 protein [Bacteroidota bacterium]
MRNISVGWWLVIAISCLYWLPFLLAKGMFLDGVCNALYAVNLAEGTASFWAPKSNYIGNPSAWGSAPLSIYILSVLYKCFGNYFFIEKIYSLICGFIQMALIAWAWKLCFDKNDERGKYGWFPCLLWLASPLTGWCYSNNLMENSMSIFTTSSIVVWLLYLRNQQIQYAVAGGILIFLALLSKGPVGLFPLAAPLVFMLMNKNIIRQRFFYFTFVQAFVFFLVFVVVFSMEAPQTFLHQYLDVQLRPALNHQNGGISFEIILQLLLALLPIFGAVIIVVLYTAIKKDDSLLSRNDKNLIGLSFLLIGLTASIPIMMSTKQSKFYLLPSLSIFSLGFSLLLLPALKKSMDLFDRYPLRYKILSATKFLSASIIILCIVLCINNRGIYSRDKALLNDLAEMQTLTGDGAILRGPWELNSEWHLFSYLSRLYKIKICMPDSEIETNYYITYSGKSDKVPSQDFIKIYSGNKFDLYQLASADNFHKRKIN